VLERIQALQDLATQSVTNKFFNVIIYRLFNNSLVDYAPKYRDMQSTVMHKLEVYVKVKLVIERLDSWIVSLH